ncbi:MAG: hypothetical protein Tsb0013_01990 [Phycisphaerales bacterium]
MRRVQQSTQRHRVRNAQVLARQAEYITNLCGGILNVTGAQPTEDSVDTQIERAGVVRSVGEGGGFRSSDQRLRSRAELGDRTLGRSDLTEDFRCCRG